MAIILSEGFIGTFLRSVPAQLKGEIYGFKQREHEKIRGLILFTAVVCLAVVKLDVLLEGIFSC